MSLRVEQRALAQSDQQEVVVLGPSPAEETRAPPTTEGAYKILGVRNGLTISVFDIVVGEDFVGRYQTEPCVAIDCLFHASGQGWILDAGGARAAAVPYRPGRVYVMSAPKGATGYYDVPLGTRFRGIDIRVGMDLWERLGAGDLLDALNGEHPLHSASSGETWVGVLPVPPELLGHIKALFDSAMSERGDLVLEARALDIISTAIAAMRKVQPAATPPRDRRQLRQVRELMVSDLARDWTIEALAREAGLSQKRLKTGFRGLYGVAVYAYLQEQRLLEARRLLGAGGMSVTQIALSVGYNSASHFSRLFARRFGLQPSRVPGFAGRPASFEADD
ncbi:helix-turn-helix domain-containing protein [Nitratireductor pacificus]|uniref:Putative transcription regulator protein n=1 Tax=Nitratireductor pacificus pht-3B TaxID=391937 RepID=K2MZT0_9HYPH|nr:AraC family transcriptional regulator [Nitratireductor pacificus]EKF17493.1 putative transcription regulator protein [Nitratireductor pacificus pht-3B]